VFGENTPFTLSRYPLKYPRVGQGQGAGGKPNSLKGKNNALGRDDLGTITHTYRERWLLFSVKRGCARWCYSWVRTTLVGQNHATTRYYSPLLSTNYSLQRRAHARPDLEEHPHAYHMLTRWHPTGRSQRERWLLFSVKAQRRMCPAVSDAPHRRASTGPARGPAHGKQTGRNGNSR
jgi:hypothetical protein